MSAIGLGLVGIGNWGQKCTRTLGQLPESNLLVVHDVDPRALDRIDAGSGAGRTADFDEFLTFPGLGAVIIATPDDTHFDLALRLIEAGLDVLVEKPMTGTGEQALRLHQAAESRGRVLAVGHVMLYHPAYRALRDDGIAGRYGRVLAIETVRTSSGPPGPAHTDVLADLACHDLAMAVALKGAPVAARAEHAEGCSRSATFELVFEDKSMLKGTVAWTDRNSTRRFTLHGTEGSHTLDHALPERTPLEHTPLARQCLDFIDCCQTRRTPVSDSELGIDVMHALDAMRESAGADGGWTPIACPAAVS